MSSCLTYLLLFLESLTVLCNVDIYHCSTLMKPGVFSDGDLLLDGFIPLHDLKPQPKIEILSFLHQPTQRSPGEWDWSHYPHVLAFLFAIEEINKNSHLLPNLTLGVSIYNAISFDHKTLENVLLWLSGGNQTVPNYNCQKQKKPVAILTGTKPEFLEGIGPLLELYRIPQVTYGPFDSSLSDKAQFPSLYQMASKDSSLVHGVIYLLQHFDWTWVGFLASEGIKGERFLWELKEQMLKKGICIANEMMLSNYWFRNSELAIMTFECSDVSKINVWIVHGKAEFFVWFHIRTTICGYYGKIWIMITESYVDLHKINTMSFFHGSLSFSPQRREMPDFEHFVKTFNPSKYSDDFYIIKFWLDTFHCSFVGSQCGELPDCPPNSTLELMQGDVDLMTTSESSYVIYNAVYAVARALHQMLLAETETKMTNDTNQPPFFSWQLHQFLRTTEFSNSFRDHIVSDDKRNTNMQKQYDILNVVAFPTAHGFMSKVGEFVSSGPNNQTLFINEDIIQWPIELEKPPQAVCTPRCGPGFRKVANETYICCFKCAFCPKGEISNKKDTPQCIQCSEQEYPNQQRTYCLPKLVTYLAFEDPFGMALVCTALFLSVITVVILWVFVKNQDTPIVKANNRTLSYILLVSLFFCFLCSLLFIGHPNIVTCFLQQVTFAVVFTVAVSTVLAKTITVILAFRALKPGRTLRWLLVSGVSNYIIPVCTLIQVIICGIWLGLSPPFIDIDSQTEPKHLLIVCNKGSVTAFYCVLGYLGFLALLSFSLSYMVRNLPDTFNEAKFLTFSMLVFCSIWVTFLPVYHSAQGKVMVALEIFSILTSSAGLLVCIFAPKCYIILIRPDKNSLKSLRNKVGLRRNAPS